MPLDLSPSEMRQLEELSHLKRRFNQGEYLYRCGDKFQSLFAIHSGSFKSQVLHEDGAEQVIGFQMVGEIIGLEAICSDCHSCDAVALEDSIVCELPYEKLEVLSQKLPTLQHHLYKIMSKEIAHDQGIMLLLGSMRAEARLAAFLLNLSKRLAARGHSPTQFKLRMSRQEIGSYLGLKLETVSRAFSHFQSADLIKVKRREIELLDLVKLQSRLDNSC